MSSDGSEADSSGTFNPHRKRVGLGPSPANQAENRMPVDVAEQADPTVFHQERALELSRHLTPETAGVAIQQRPGQSSDRKEVGADEHTVQATSEQWWKQPRETKNPARRGETEH